MAKANNGGSGVKAAGLGLAALAAAAAGAYYFYGKDGAKNRKSLKGWMVKAKGEVMDRMEQLSDITEKDYIGTVTDVLAKYKNLKKVTPAELAGLKKDMLSHWAGIKKDLTTASKNVVKQVQSPKPSKKR